MVYTEARLCPSLFTVRGLSSEEALKIVLAAFAKGEKKYDIKVRVIIVFFKPNPGKLRQWDCKHCLAFSLSLSLSLFFFLFRVEPRLG